MRVNEMIAGVRGDVAVKIYGDDFDVLTELGNRVGGLLGSTRGAADISTEQITGQPVLEIRVDQSAIARYGVDAKSLMDLVESISGKELGQIAESQMRFPLVARLAESSRQSAETIGTMPVRTAGGHVLPLRALANVSVVEGPSTITREWGRRRAVVQVNVRGRDIGGFIDEAQQKIAALVHLPQDGRYHIEWGGQFENMQRARRRLMLVVPLVLAMIFALLYITYNRVLDALRVFTGVPLAAIGGVVALWLRDMPFSISAAVGFIALSGVAVLGDMVLVSYVRQLRAQGLPLRECVERAALTRLRPVLMTALVASLGFIPMALSTGMGAEVQRPLATVVIGGVISSTLLTLLVLPCIYLVFGSKAAQTGRYDEAVEEEAIELPGGMGSVLAAREPAAPSSVPPARAVSSRRGDRMPPK
jgi:cobalt-zinc-cadmium resistance protein CzcA